MRKRDRSGLAMAPLFLRLALALTFIWAGLSKLVDRFEVRGEQAAILANYGVIPAPHAPRPETAPPVQPPASPPAEPEAEPGAEPTPDAAPDAPDEPQARAVVGPTAPVHLVSWQNETQSRFLATAADFPDPVSVRRYAGLVLLLHSAINPGLSAEDSAPLMPLWPDLDRKTDYDPWPRYLALGVAVTELLGGVLVGVGLLTRLSALSLAGVMLGAIWLTTVGPAVQSGHAVLGFLPDHAPFDGEAWTVPLWQFALLCAAMSLFFAGPGTLSLDRLLLGGAPRAEPPRPAPQAQQPQGKKK